MNHEPNELCKKLKQSATSRTAKSIDIIHQVCTEQAERGSSDFTVATIGRLSEAAHGPKTQAIRNKTGGQYRALIQSWAKFKKPLKVSSGKVKDKYSWVDDITDSRIKWLVLDLVAQQSRLTGQLQLAKEQANIHIDLRPIAQSESLGGVPLPSLTTPKLLKSEILALSHSIDSTQFAKKGWIADERGRVMDEKGSEVFKVGFISAIEKLLSV